MNARMLAEVGAVVEPLVEVYRDLHAHPELSFAEHRTAGIVAARLTDLGADVLTNVGGTGVVAVLRNGAGRTVALRADMDGLPVREDTGLDYASRARGVDPDGLDVPLMHACGHDMHVVCLLGAVELLQQRRDDWSGTVVAVFQPAEEAGGGARSMVDDGLWSRVPSPDVVLGQHVGPAPAGAVGAHAGEAFAGADSLSIHLYGRGGHGSRPETTVDPVVMAASTVMRLQTVVSREIAAPETAVLTVGQVHAGTKNNIIPDEAHLGVSIRSTKADVREHVLDALNRIVRAEAVASGAEREPEIVMHESFPVLVNDVAATARVMDAFRAAFGSDRVIDPGAVTGSEDVGALATAAGVPLVYWILGGADAAAYAAAAAAGTLERDIPSNHSPHFAPVIHPTLETGVASLVTAANVWLADGATPAG